uniref:PAS domain-containing protein n=1 Tax=Falsiroseomonas oryziterrae TaxID=2911368 RepID=UPI0035590219
MAPRQQQLRWRPAALLNRLLAPRDEVGPLLRAVLDAAAPGLALLDAADRLLAWNPELARLCGPTLPLRRGLPLRTLIEPSRRVAVEASLGAAGSADAALAAAGLPQVRLERP